jgi:hypothetical protein
VALTLPPVKADHFLQRNDVRTDLAQNLRNTVRANAAIQATAFMDIVRSDAQPLRISSVLAFSIHMFPTTVL